MTSSTCRMRIVVFIRALALDFHAAENTALIGGSLMLVPCGTPPVKKLFAGPGGILTGAAHQPGRWSVRSHQESAMSSQPGGSRSNGTGTAALLHC